MAHDKRLLILGGTAEARALADRAVAAWGDRVDVVTSLAGRTSDARLPTGEVRHGGFGGAAGLADYLRAESVDAVIDATHPFAAEITAHAAEACRACGVPHVILARPTWTLPPGLAVHRVSDMAGAATAIADIGARNVLVTVGHRGLDALAGLDDVHFIVRQIEAHEGPLPLADAECLIQRPPYRVEDERALMRERGVDALLTKESGGGATAAKLEAASELGIPVVMIERPPLPEADRVSSVDEALGWAVAALDIGTKD